MGSIVYTGGDAKLIMEQLANARGSLAVAIQNQVNAKAITTGDYLVTQFAAIDADYRALQDAYRAIVDGTVPMGIVVPPSAVVEKAHAIWQRFHDLGVVYNKRFGASNPVEQPRLPGGVVDKVVDKVGSLLLWAGLAYIGWRLLDRFVLKPRRVPRANHGEFLDLGATPRYAGGRRKLT